MPVSMLPQPASLLDPPLGFALCLLTATLPRILAYPIHRLLIIRLLYQASSAYARVSCPALPIS